MNKKMLFFPFLLLFLLILLPPLVDAKSYSIDKAEINIIINPDSIVDVNETIYFNFDGSFTFAFG